MFYKILNILRIFLTVLNLYLFMAVVLNTAITATGLFVATAVYFVIGYVLYQWIKDDWTRLFGWFDYFGILIPLIFNGFFLINYHFSSDPVTGIYYFSNQRAENTDFLITDKTSGKSTTIILENGFLNDYYLLRTFTDTAPMHGKEQVMLHTETGLFGLLVLKSYQFLNEKH